MKIKVKDPVDCPFYCAWSEEVEMLCHLNTDHDCFITIAPDCPLKQGPITVELEGE